jgi:hypothetical protein
VRRLGVFLAVSSCVLMTCVWAGSTARPRSGSLSGAEAELLALHAADRQAHFSHDVDGLLAHVSEEILDVRDGDVRRMTREELQSRFREYFSKARFTAVGRCCGACGASLTGWAARMDHCAGSSRVHRDWWERNGERNG